MIEKARSLRSVKAAVSLGAVQAAIRPFYVWI